jgi:hypothetical protein
MRVMLLLAVLLIGLLVMPEAAVDGLSLAENAVAHADSAPLLGGPPESPCRPYCGDSTG